jgi:hypothetical protein
MAETTPHLAPIVVLLFLGAVFVTGVSLVILLYGAARRSKLSAHWRRRRADGCCVLPASALQRLAGEQRKDLASGRLEILLRDRLSHRLFSLRSRDGWRARPRDGTDFGPRSICRRSSEGLVRRAHCFSETRRRATHTQRSPRRARRRKRPCVRAISRRRSQARACEWRRGVPATTIAPRPIFRKGSCLRCTQRRPGLRLLITEDDPETLLIIGHENSLLHRKIYLGLDSAPRIIREISSLAPGN